MDVEHMRRLAVSSRFGEGHRRFRYGFIMSLCLRKGLFLLCELLCDCPAVLLGEVRFPVHEILYCCSEYLHSVEGLRRVVQVFAFGVVCKVGCSVSCDRLLSEFSGGRVEVIEFVYSCPVAGEDYLVTP